MTAADQTPDRADEPIDPLQTFDCDDLAKLLKVSRKWVEAQVAGERIPFTRIGPRLVRFTRSDVEQILAAGAKSPSGLPRARRLAGIAATSRRGRGRAA